MQGSNWKNKSMKCKGALTIALAAIIMLSVYFAFESYFSPSAPGIESAGEVGLELIADGLVSPVDITFADDGSERLFIADLPGKIIAVNSDRTFAQFLDITDRVVKLSNSYDERGLLGLAFHPRFSENGLFYVFYNAEPRKEAPAGWDSTIRISEFRVSKDEPNKADFNSERILLEIDKPAMNHNGGQLAFGPDGFLYISTGDGGNANDVGEGHNPEIGNGQDTFSLLGKILRIDVNTKVDGKEYGIPKDNPFSDGKEGLAEIYAYGFRNPWRISFDNKGRLFAGDAGQNLWEEIDIVEKGGNYGWNIHEGTHCFDVNNADKSPETCSSTGYNGELLLNPVIEYPNAKQKAGLGRTNVGGFLYTGKAIPYLRNKFIFADWSMGFVKGDGTLFAAAEAETGLWQFREIKIAGRKNGRIGEFILALGRDADNELYIAASENAGQIGDTGKVYKLVPAIA